MNRVILFLKELKRNTMLYGCFIVFGTCIGSYTVTMFNTIMVSVLFCLSVIAIEYQNKNYSDVTNWLLNNLYVIYIAIVFGIFNVPIIEFVISCFFIILFVDLRKFELKLPLTQGE